MAQVALNSTIPSPLAPVSTHPSPQLRSDLHVSAERPRPVRSFPIPREDNCYSRAKRFEYIEKDLEKAEKCYLTCIEKGIRAESALKDLASLWHQRGRTEEACNLLEKHKQLVKEDMEKYRNLLSNLREKVETRNPRYLILSDLPQDVTEAQIRQMFTHPQRIMDISLTKEANSVRSRLKCMSISAAKKTIGCFLRRKELLLELEDLEDKHTEASDTETEERLWERSEEDLLGSELVAALNAVA